MSLPNTFLIGAPKAGTTTIAGWLAAHPEVWFSVPKEPFYWAADYPRLREHYGFATRAQYEALFVGAKADEAKRLAEGSTVYLYSDRAVPDLMAAVPAARVIVAVRNPLDLVVSYHRTQVVALNETRTDILVAWRGAMAGTPAPGKPLDPKLLDYPRVARLGHALELVLSVVPREQVHVVVFDDLVANPRGEWAKLQQFLDLEPVDRPALERRNSSDKAARFPALRRLLHRPPEPLEAPIRALRGWSRASSSPTVEKVKHAMWRTSPPPRADPAMRVELMDALEEDVALLGGLLNRDLSHWWAV